jgi:hypothetical protein
MIKYEFKPHMCACLKHQIYDTHACKWTYSLFEASNIRHPCMQADMKVFMRNQGHTEAESARSKLLFTIPSSDVNATLHNEASVTDSGRRHLCLKRDSSPATMLMTARTASVTNSFGGFAMLPNSMQSRRSSSTSRGPPPTELVASASVALKILERMLMGEQVCCFNQCNNNMTLNDTDSIL